MSVADSQVAAVLCHPHPQMGGSMHDMVLGAVHESLIELGVTTLRFNFRGVGASEGSYDNGDGETHDTLAAIQWLRDNSDAKRLLLAGYSFGGVMSLRVASVARPDALLLVAPAVSIAKELSCPDIPSVEILGDNDPFVDATETRQWFGEQASVETIDADHFFFGEYDTIGQRIGLHQSVLLGS
ncbi:MAG: alpha/beta fold hydrolase [Pseudomonadales bacterium]|nr:alpha/beta fold hydrolase [Pseudomonadales bacterium]